PDLRMVGLNIDVTERQRSEQLLRESEERLRLAVSGAELGTWHWNLQTGEVVFSERASAIFGLSAEFAVTYDSFLALIHSDDRAHVGRGVADASRGGVEYDVE